MAAGGSMRTSKLALGFVTLCMLAAPAAAAPAAPPRAAQTDRAPARAPASAGELDQYAQRERAAEPLQKFEGGRGRYIEASTLIIILLVVILVVILV
jgi:hypothetical protein